MQTRNVYKCLHEQHFKCRICDNEFENVTKMCSHIKYYKGCRVHGKNSSVNHNLPITLKSVDVIDYLHNETKLACQLCRSLDHRGGIVIGSLAAHFIRFCPTLSKERRDAVKQAEKNIIKIS